MEWERCTVLRGKETIINILPIKTIIVHEHNEVSIGCTNPEKSNLPRTVATTKAGRGFSGKVVRRKDLGKEESIRLKIHMTRDVTIEFCDRSPTHMGS